MEVNMTYIIWAVALMISGYWIFRIQVRGDYQKKGKLSFLSSFLEFAFFAFHANMMYVFIPVSWGRLPPLSGHPLWNLVSLVCIIVGLIIVATSMIPLGFGRSMGLQSRRLKTNGLYRLSRNPQLIGYSILLIGYIISYFTLYAIGWFILLWINIHWMIISEEEHLVKVYEDEYEDYCRKVPRYLDTRSIRNIFKFRNGKV